MNGEPAKSRSVLWVRRFRCPSGQAMPHREHTPRLASLPLVAPANPDQFGLCALLPEGPLGPPTTLTLSSNAPG